MSQHSNYPWVVDVIGDGPTSIEVDGRSVTLIPAWMWPEGVREAGVLWVTHDSLQGKSALLIETDPGAERKALGRSAEQDQRKAKNGALEISRLNADQLPTCSALLGSLGYDLPENRSHRSGVESHELEWKRHQLVHGRRDSPQIEVFEDSGIAGKEHVVDGKVLALPRVH